jgi:hypothetical protein
MYPRMARPYLIPLMELKRELTDSSCANLESRYVAQAAGYQASDYSFGLALLLDLSHEQTTAIPYLQDLVWASRTSTGPS